MVYPVRCPICDEVVDTSFGKWQYPVCDSCRKKVEYVKEPVCKKCGKPISDERGEFCGDCRKRSHVFLQGRALWVYEKEVKQSIYRLKYGNRREYGLSYAQEIVKYYGEWIQRKQIDMIIPIPLHKKRMRQRGYNQAEIIAEEIGRQMNLPVCKNVLVRCIDTNPQKELNDRERKNNLKNAFKIVKNNVKLKHILVVDDIFTTGSTIDGAAEALKIAGATEVYFVSVSIGKGD